MKNVNTASRHTIQKAHVFMCALLLFSAVPTRPTSDATRLAVSAVGGIVGALGLYSLYNFIAGETDEEFIVSARRDIMAHRGGYAAALDVVYNRAHELNMSSHDMYAYARQIDESLLYALARAKHSSVSIALYRTGLAGVLRDLHKAHRDAQQRLASQSDSLIRNQLLRIEGDLKSLIESLEALASFLSHHESYFDIYETEAQLGVKYAQELRLLADYAASQDMQARAIRHFVIAQSSVSSTPFAHVEYRRILDRDIMLVERCINRSAYNYQGRLGAARQLLGTLQAIKSYVVTDPAYSQELIHYEQDQREKERLRIEREKAAIERRKVAEQERRAREARWQKERELQLKEEENALKRQELIIKQREATAYRVPHKIY